MSFELKRLGIDVGVIPNSFKSGTREPNIWMTKLSELFSEFFQALDNQIDGSISKVEGSFHLLKVFKCGLMKGKHLFRLTDCDLLHDQMPQAWIFNSNIKSDIMDTSIHFRRARTGPHSIKG